jgi:hypothetical protein
VYSLVECGDCRAIWIVEGRPDTTACPRCTTRHRFESLRPLSIHDDKPAATAARGSILADRSDHGDEFDAATVADAVDDR